MSIITVVETDGFERDASAIMGDEERMELIDYVARNPEAGIGIGGGIRKFRFARPGEGKSGGYRVVHFYAGNDSIPIILLAIFAKNEKANLSGKETASLKNLGKRLAAKYGGDE